MKIEMIKTSDELYKIGRAYGLVVNRLFPVSGYKWRGTPFNEAAKELEKMTGLTVPDLENGSQRIFDVADGIIREELGMGDKYRCIRHKPALGPEIRDNRSLDSLLNQLIYADKETSEPCSHQKLCCVSVRPRIGPKKAYCLVSNPLVVSPLAALYGNEGLRRYIELDPANPEQSSAAGRNSGRRFSAGGGMYEIACSIGEMVGAKEILLPNSGNVCLEDERSGRQIFSSTFQGDFKGSAIFSFRDVPEVDGAFPLIARGWEVVGSNPKLAERLVEMRGKMFSAPDLAIHDGEDLHWAKMELETTRKAFDDFNRRLQPVIGSLSDDRGTASLKQNVSTIAKILKGDEIRIESLMQRLVTRVITDDESGTFMSLTEKNSPVDYIQVISNNPESLEGLIDAEIKRRNLAYLDGMKELRERAASAEAKEVAPVESVGDSPLE